MSTSTPTPGFAAITALREFERLCDLQPDDPRILRDLLTSMMHLADVTGIDWAERRAPVIQPPTGTAGFRFPAQLNMDLYPEGPVPGLPLRRVHVRRLGSGLDPVVDNTYRATTAAYTVVTYGQLAGLPLDPLAGPFAALLTDLQELTDVPESQQGLPRKGKRESTPWQRALTWARHRYYTQLQGLD